MGRPTGLCLSLRQLPPNQAGRREGNALTLDAACALENSQVEEIPALVKRIVPVIAREVNTRLQRAFTLWMLCFLDKELPEDLEGFDLGALDELEAKHMLEKTIEEYKKKVQEERWCVDARRTRGRIPARSALGHFNRNAK